MSDEKYVALEHQFYDRFAEDDICISVRFKRPSAPQVARMQKSALKDAARGYRTLLTDTVHPEDKEALVEYLKAYPGLSATFGGELLKSVGFGELGN